MLAVLTRDLSNARFLTYVALLYLLSMSAGSLLPEGSDLSTVVKLALLPLAQCFLLIGCRQRWPQNYPQVVQASSAFYAGIALATFLF